jgi:hypothetical protein
VAVLVGGVDRGTARRGAKSRKRVHEARVAPREEVDELCPHGGLRTLDRQEALALRVGEDLSRELPVDRLLGGDEDEEALDALSSALVLQLLEENEAASQSLADARTRQIEGLQADLRVEGGPDRSALEPHEGVVADRHLPMPKGVGEPWKLVLDDLVEEAVPGQPGAQRAERALVRLRQDRGLRGGTRRIEQVVAEVETDDRDARPEPGTVAVQEVGVLGRPVAAECQRVHIAVRESREPGGPRAFHRRREAVGLGVSDGQHVHAPGHGAVAESPGVVTGASGRDHDGEDRVAGELGLEVVDLVEAQTQDALRGQQADEERGDQQGNRGQRSRARPSAPRLARAAFEAGFRRTHGRAIDR